MFLLVTVVLIAVIAFNFKLIYHKFEAFFYDEYDKVKTVRIKDGNIYSKKVDYNFVQISKDYVPYNYNDIINIFYSILDNGWDDFTFYCPKTYTNCINDFDEISHNKTLLSNIRDFVHPYNQYSSMDASYNSNGKIEIKVKYLYTKDEIKKIDKDIDNIIIENIDNSMSDVEKIKALHDYVINNTRYDQIMAETNESPYDSERIGGLLYDGYAVCSAYADIMAVMLNKLDIPNFKVSSESHVWNAVYLDGRWLNLDLTWDDPISTSGKDILDDTYFLINTDKLLSLDIKEDKNDHTYNKKVFSEIN